MRIVIDREHTPALSTPIAIAQANQSLTKLGTQDERSLLCEVAPLPQESLEVEHATICGLVCPIRGGIHKVGSRGCRTRAVDQFLHLGHRRWRDARVWTREREGSNDSQRHNEGGDQGPHPTRVADHEGVHARHVAEKLVATSITYVW